MQIIVQKKSLKIDIVGLEIFNIKKVPQRMWNLFVLTPMVVIFVS